MTWTIGNKTVASLTINNKEVQSIVRSSDNVILYEKPFTGPTPSSITLVSNQSILAYNNSESATLTATVKDANNTVIEGATVEFYKGSTSLGTSTTNSNGIATKTYSSTGAGDVSFTATAGNVTSSAVTIEDCTYYNTTESSITRGSSYQQQFAIATDVIGKNDNWVLTFDAKGVSKGGCINIGANGSYTLNSSTANYRLGIGFDYVSNKLVYYANNRTNSSSTTTTGSPSSNTYYSFKMERNGTTVTFYYDTTLFATKTVSWLGNYNQYDLYPSIWSGTNSKLTWKNLKLKKI